MSDLQVIIITNEEEEKDKAVLFDPKEGRASKGQLCVYALAWLLMSLVAPLWMASIVESPYTMLVPPQAQTGLLLAPSSPCIKLEDCGAFATSFNVSLEANLVYAPTTAYPPVLFASVSHPNPRWWVAGIADSPLTKLNQTWEINGGCFSAPGGKLYLVACLPAEGEVFKQGDQLRGPPFDDRCTAIGTWCGGSCSSVISPPNCDITTHEITPLKPGRNIIENNATLPAGTYTLSSRSAGYMAAVFVFFTSMSFITFLLNHFAPVVACLQRLGKSEEDNVRNQFPALDKLQYKRKDVAVAVVSIFCYEKVFHITRNLIGVACSWTMLAKVTKELGFKTTRFVHYVVDNSHTNTDCMSALLTRFVNFVNDNPDINWDSIVRGLQDAPFEPTPEEYAAMIPLRLREAIAAFLADLREDDRKCFEPFSAVNTRFWRVASPTNIGTDKKTVPKLTTGSVTVDIEIVRLPNGNRSKVAALQECGKLFHGYKKDSLGYLAIMDARHMMTPAFWQYTLPAFFVRGSTLGIIPPTEANGERGVEEFFENTSLRLAQVMQHFPIVHTVDDYFDRGNFFNYLYSNALRNQVQSVSSCGTNALWSMRDTPSGAKFNFSGKTLIEDTETSHAFMDQGETSTYISKGLVHGSVKNPEEYGEAPSRWAAGAIQLLFCQPSALRFLAYSMLAYIGLPAGISLVVIRVRHGEWVLLGVWTAFAVCIALWSIVTPRKVGAAQTVIRMINTTYWLTGPLTAIFWMVFVPVYILLSGELPFQFNAEAMMLGGLLVSGFQWVMVVLAKRWAKAEEMHLWRSQQAWFALWPLNFLGIPRLLNPNTSWQISTIQAKVTLFVNLCEFLLLCASLTVAMLNVSARVATLTSAAAFLVGILSALYAIFLLFPTTSYLFNSLLFGKRHPYNTSSRHILGAFLVLSLVMYLVYSPDWTLAFSQFFVPAHPSWYTP